MLFSNLELEKIQSRLSSGLGDTEPVRDPRRAGFDPSGEYAGTTRQTFSLALNEEDHEALGGAVDEIYAAIIQELAGRKPGLKPVPFDFVRLDAFYDAERKQVQVLEINAKTVSMHEFTEWLDGEVAELIQAKSSPSLNDQIALLQYRIAAAHKALPVVLAQRNPQWLYADALQRVLGKDVTFIAKQSLLRVNNSSASVGDKHYKTVIYKGMLQKEQTALLAKLDAEQKVLLLQSPRVSAVGKRKFLQSLRLPSVPQTVSLQQYSLEQLIEEQEWWVLKREDSSGSRGVWVGPQTDASDWQVALKKAYKQPELWVVQQYVAPAKLPVVPHGQPRSLQLPAQLSIFIMPDTENYARPLWDIYARAYAGKNAVIFDPAGEHADIWFGNVIIQIAKR